MQIRYSIHTTVTDSNRAFSLLEVVIVLGIISILYALIAPLLFSTRLRAGETQCGSNLHQVYVALQLYKQDYGDYPDFRPPDQLTPAYVSSPTIFICPLEFRRLSDIDPSDAPSKVEVPSSYLWPCIPRKERDNAYERRGELLPLVYCNVHTVISSGKSSILIMRSDGSLDHVPARVMATATSSYDF